MKEFLRAAQPAFAGVEREEPKQCEGCGMPAYGSLCAFCRLVREVRAKAGCAVRRNSFTKASLVPGLAASSRLSTSL